MNFDLAQKLKFPESGLFSLANLCLGTAEVVFGGRADFRDSRHQYRLLIPKDLQTRSS
jgi:hypothetical protein